MAHLSPQQVAKLAYDAGFRGGALTLAVAVAFAESGGDPANTGHNTDGSVDRGLWQINNKAHPDVTDACAFSPPCNAAAAYRISDQGRNWRPWVAYTSGAYRSHVSSAQIGAGDVTRDPGNNWDLGSTTAGDPGAATPIDIPGESALRSLGDLVAIVAKAAAWVANPHNATRIVEIAAGVVGLVVGVVVIAENASAGSAAGKAARTVTKTAGAVAAA
jgi:hypothetical protein